MFLEPLFPAVRWTGRLLLLVTLASGIGCDSSDKAADATSSAVQQTPAAAMSPVAATSPSASPALLRLSAATGFAGVAEGANATISTTPQGLVVQALTTDPSILLPQFTNPTGKPFSIRLQFVSPGPTNLQIFYDTKEHGAYWDENHSIRKPTAGGDNDITVTITEPNFGGRIRIDPGDLTGKYVVKLIEIRN